MAGAVRVKGLKELQRDFRKMGGDLPKLMRAELREVGDIVRDDARSRFASVDARSAAGYRTVVRQRGVAVEQRLRRTTGAHPGYGAMQMREALAPALDDKQGEVVKRVEGMLDNLADRNGF
jgi:hypothetical protein